MNISITRDQTEQSLLSLLRDLGHSILFGPNSANYAHPTTTRNSTRDYPHHPCNPCHESRPYNTTIEETT